MPTLCLAGGHLQDGQCVDLEVESDTIVAIRPALPRRPSPQLVDAHGYLLLPAPAEAHAHLDKVLTASLLANPTGDLDGAVSAWYEHRTRVNHEEIVQRAMRAARLMLSFGATAIRTHVDVGTTTGLRFAHAMNDVRAQLRTELDLQVVGFVDVPTTGATGAANRKLLRDALAVGVDVIGGAPYRDPDPAGCQRTVRASQGVRSTDRPAHRRAARRQQRVFNPVGCARHEPARCTGRGQSLRQSQPPAAAGDRTGRCLPQTS